MSTDEIFHYKTAYNFFGSDASEVIQGNAFCRLRINEYTVIASELPDSGKSITNAAEKVAEQVCQYYEIPPRKLQYIEHYPADTSMGEEFSLVSFQFVGSRLRQPQWTQLSREQAVQLFGADIKE
ncbi:MAG: hypothetical protein AAFY72_03940 [Cyanobacteria bacterium J06649_4]